MSGKYYVPNVRYDVVTPDGVFHGNVELLVADQVVTGGIGWNRRFDLDCVFRIDEQSDGDDKQKGTIRVLDSECIIERRLGR